MATVHPWGHDALAADLAKRLRNDGKNWTWLNTTIGAWSGPRPDIMAFPRWRYDLPQIHAYEIKVSRSDLLSDLNSEKWRKYLEHCQSVTFVMPHGLATKDEIPSECGVMLRTGRGWRTERRPTFIGGACSIQAMAKLLTCHPAREPYPGLGKWETDGLARAARDKFQSVAGEKYGHALARLAADIADGHDPAGKAQAKADEIIAEAKAEAERLRKDLAPVLGMLGISEDAQSWEISRRIREAAQKLDADLRVAQVENALAEVRRTLDAVSREIAA
jgi:hypothetical protein